MKQPLYQILKSSFSIWNQRKVSRNLRESVVSILNLTIFIFFFQLDNLIFFFRPINQAGWLMSLLYWSLILYLFPTWQFSPPNWSNCCMSWLLSPFFIWWSRLTDVSDLHATIYLCQPGKRLTNFFISF